MKEYEFGDIKVLSKSGAAEAAKDEQQKSGASARSLVSTAANAAANAMRFHSALPGYGVTELAALKDRAKAHGIKGIYVKDESSRFGLKSFKGLGGSYALFRILCERLGFDPKRAVPGDFAKPDIREKCRDMVFVTATDGNHGRGVAWAAKLFGCSSRVYMPAGSVEVRRKAIEDAGADLVEITELNYDKTVALASGLADENGWILVQDTAWDGYEDIPRWIVEGYMTMAKEACDQLERFEGEGGRPTHVFLQAGVGAMAGAAAAYILNRYKDAPPVIAVAEPDTVACIYLSAEAGDGAIHSVEGDPVTIMAGLNCGTPCSVTWPVLRDGASLYCKCSDSITVRGMRAYARPEGGDPAVVSGESGAVTYGLLLEVLGDEDLRELFGIDEDSVVLLFSTEGDTDPEGYARAVGR